MRFAAAQSSDPAFLQKLRLPDSGGKILVAVSGGIDSVVLLYALKALSKKNRWKLTVAHFNHRLRGRASDADEALVRKTAAMMKLPFMAGGADVKRFARGSKLSVEMAARKLRHEFFAQSAHDRKIGTVALAHHADDQVELFFLRLLRGAGGRGLSGMRWRSPSPVDRRISLVRPLLGFSRAELVEFARKNKIRYREDASNLSQDFLRNRIRYELLPLLRRDYQPALNKTVLRLMEIVGEESDFTDSMARLWLYDEGRAFEKLPVAVQRQVVRLQLVELGLGADFDLIETLRQSPNQPVAVVANILVLRDARGRVSVRENETARFDETQMAVKLNKPGSVIFDGVRLKWQFALQGKDRFTPPMSKPGIEYFEADKFDNKISLRHWRAGDRFQPIGTKSAAKLQDLFTNQKIPRGRRHKLIVAESGGKIFWVEGLRISENFKLTPQTTRRLVWQWRR